MTSVKVKFRPSSEPLCKGAIYYQIIHERRVRRLSSCHEVYPYEWDDRRGCLTLGRSDSDRARLISVKEGIRRDLDLLGRIIRRLEEDGIFFTSDDVVDAFGRFASEYSLFGYMERVIARLHGMGQHGTAANYHSALRSFRKFRCGADLRLDSLDESVMEDYEGWLYAKGAVANTVSFYMRILRAVYNRAVDSGAIADRRPFRHVYTGIGRTVKRALSIPMIRKIRNLTFPEGSLTGYARDIFMLSFYLRGMSFIDMAFLRKSDLVDGCLSYRRRKTGRLLAIRWTSEMQEIVDRYPDYNSEYLLPILRGNGGNERSGYRNKCYNINRHLKKVAAMLGIEIPLTLYVARHSWASAAKAKGIPVSVISEGMGHDSESTTQIYLASLDASVVDRANSMIINSI